MRHLEEDSQYLRYFPCLGLLAWGQLDLIFWGAFHALCFLPLLLWGKNRKNVGAVVACDRMFPTLRELSEMAITFVVVVIGWTFFRAPDIMTAFGWLKDMFVVSSLSLADARVAFSKPVILPLVSLLAIEWFNRRRDIPVLPANKLMRWMVYCVTFAMIFYMKLPAQTFIYFQF